ncbi:Cro/Cl family transcriptional regulator [Pseudoduganella eburnea]|uniref:Cro/Cl family transcriptional regulator n=1 Tax=Massilia eburnea TaxID=1776165 RepID=A0A6L6QH27_9BURK|nr:YdaS family helix-turn-helix protein [Massilia eburnea]MTW11410.1 Cro/Cl family transcriptional regulator [Massilia eburnea]
MEKLLKFLNGLAKVERALFCGACGTSERYLRKAISIQQRLGADLCINIERESKQAVRCEDLRPDVDWAYIRRTDCP